MRGRFDAFAKRATELAGSLPALVLSFALVFVWAINGPVFGFSDTWQLVINTTTTIITFLMVVIIQHTQNVDSDEVHSKLDEIIDMLKSEGQS